MNITQNLTFRMEKITKRSQHLASPSLTPRVRVDELARFVQREKLNGCSAEHSTAVDGSPTHHTPLSAARLKVDSGQVKVRVESGSRSPPPPTNGSSHHLLSPRSAEPEAQQNQRISGGIRKGGSRSPGGPGQTQRSCSAGGMIMDGGMGMVIRLYENGDQYCSSPFARSRSPPRSRGSRSGSRSPKRNLQESPNLNPVAARHVSGLGKSADKTRGGPEGVVSEVQGVVTADPVVTVEDESTRLHNLLMLDVYRSRLNR